MYQTLARRALTALEAGRAVIADAVDASPDEQAVLAERLRERVADVSDATVDVLQRQWQLNVGQLDWRRLDGSLDAASVRGRAEVILAEP